MYLKKTNLMMVFTILFFYVWVSSALAGVEYQNRGNRNEGVRQKPVSGYDIELISVLVNYKEEAKQMPDRFKLKFYLAGDSKVYLTVRELDYKEYYWLDKVQPRKPWRSRAYNGFEWPTQDVIQQLDRIKMYDLGVVARLEKPEPAKIERVAPVIFYHSKFPNAIKGYRFTFKTRENAKLIFSVYKDGDAKPVFKRIFRRQRGGRPFTVRWDSSTAAEGWYKLVVMGYFLDTNDPIDQAVRFYHKPVVK